MRVARREERELAGLHGARSDRPGRTERCHIKRTASERRNGAAPLSRMRCGGAATLEREKSPGPSNPDGARRTLFARSDRSMRPSGMRMSRTKRAKPSSSAPTMYEVAHAVSDETKKHTSHRPAGSGFENEASYFECEEPEATHVRPGPSELHEHHGEGAKGPHSILRGFIGILMIGRPRAHSTGSRRLQTSSVSGHRRFLLVQAGRNVSESTSCREETPRNKLEQQQQQQKSLPPFSSLRFVCVIILFHFHLGAFRATNE